jgi:hypothetical protein
MLAEMLIPACSGLGWPLERCRDLALMVLSTSCGFLWFAGALNLADDLPMPLMERLGAMLARGLAQGD